MGVLHDIGVWLWRLLPANPILVRVVTAAGHRVRHLWARVIYLLALVVVFLYGGGLLIGPERSLAELAKQYSQTFTAVSVVQLVLMSFIAPIFCAAAITQEKDSNTYHILLTTPLSNAQIVLGTLFSRLYFVWALLISGLPIFCITMIYGGVTTREIFESFGLAACTGLITGSIAIMISFLRVGTRRTIFAFFVGVAVYLLGVYAFGVSPLGQLAAAPDSPLNSGTLAPRQMSWLSIVHPFLALLVVTGQTPAPDWSDVAGFTWPASWLLVRPQYGYMILTTLASGVMILVSLVFVRRGARDTQGAWVGAILERLGAANGAERSRPSRRVWRNPIAWREARTRGSAGGRSAVRWVAIAGGFVSGFVLLLAHHNAWWGLGALSVDLTRYWLTALVWIELLVVLLVVTSTAATALTREKEALTMELLTSTPLTSRYIIAGMLQGLVRLVIPLIAVPVATVAAFALTDLVRVGTTPVTTPEAIVGVPLLLIAYTALAALVGLHFSLTLKKTVQAVMVSVAVVLGGAGLLWACGAAVAGGGSTVSAVILPFTPFPALQTLLDPWRVVGSDRIGWNVGPPTAEELTGVRMLAIIFSAIAAAAYAAVAFGVYASLEKNYDMTVRRQSA